MNRILFVCIGNICRSPIAEAVARRALPEEAIVESAGLQAIEGNRATAEAIEAAAELGLYLLDHRARPVTTLDLASYDRIIALTPAIGRTLERQFKIPRERLVILDVDDPYGCSLEIYRDCAAQLEREVQQWIEGMIGD
jgi:protein-tyrosine-phosphatase